MHCREAVYFGKDRGQARNLHARNFQFRGVFHRAASFRFFGCSRNRDFGERFEGEQHPAKHHGNCWIAPRFGPSGSERGGLTSRMICGVGGSKLPKGRTDASKARGRPANSGGHPSLKESGNGGGSVTKSVGRAQSARDRAIERQRERFDQDAKRARMRGSSRRSACS